MSPDTNGNKETSSETSHNMNHVWVLSARSKHIKLLGEHQWPTKSTAFYRESVAKL
jgi:hypothetical protein